MSLLKTTLINFVADNFVETGTCEGDGVAVALDCGFKDVHSIEIDPNLYTHCKKRFQSPNVHLYIGDSLVVLPEILSKLSAPSTFWLDAHMNDVSTYMGKFRCPILAEIDLILNHNIKHTLLIDDRRLFAGNGIAHWGNVKEQEIMDLLMYRNSRLKVSYADGHIPNDVMVVRYE